MTDTDLYLGRLFDSQNNKTVDRPFTYDPADLTTHAVVTGMTGSGKTGLCITLLEEAALQGIPALIIDPKGDLTNLLLHFSNLAPQDFQPWIDPEMARRAGKSLDQAANEAALSWRNGLGQWGIGPERLLALKNAVQFAVYTPGSDSGLLVKALSSLALPTEEERANREVLVDKISNTVTALLGLVGLKDIDPLRSREHILLAKVIEETWKQGKNVDLAELILQTQNPPFDKLGAFPVETFFPQKDRMDLAIQLNNILVSPSFQVWREGHDLDIRSMLYMPDGQPRHSIFYLAHLSDAERMFFVTLLLSAVESWVRTQVGATSLRAILYMDELFGYLPPQSNPPSKGPLLRLLKQARAFGLGLLLATQNPVDLDYKALSNAGTWFIGKLQTERDKERLLDGLESAAGDVSRGELDKLISSLGKRVFIQHNVHAKQPALFQTRWAMNFLAGPLSRNQIPALNKLVGADFLRVTPDSTESTPQTATSFEVPRAADVSQPAPTVMPVSAPQSSPSKPARSNLGYETRSPLPAGVAEYFLPTNLSLTEAMRAEGKSLPDAQLNGVLYRPALLAAANVRFLDRKYGVDTELQRAALVEDPDRRGVVRWEDHFYSNFPVKDVEREPAPQARFSPLDAPLNEPKQMTALQRDFVDWIYQSVTVTARANEALKVYAGPDVSQAEFMKACAETAREARDAEIEKVTAQIDRKIKVLEDRMAREERELREDEAELSHRKMEEMGTHAENVLGLFGGRKNTRRLSSSLTKRRMTEQAKAEVEESLDAIAQYKKEFQALEQERQAVIDKINDRWGDVVNDISEATVTPKKTDIYVELFGVAWMPYYLVETGGGMLEMPAFGRV
ncbi:MAG: ATP-binding protein [Anaerolineales bacterium]|nr:ATP-binding protein [Anaerolineales bacterium]